MASKSFTRVFIKFTFSITVSLLIGWWAYVRSGSPSYNSEFRLIEWYQIPLLCILIIIISLIRSWRLGYLFYPSYGKMRETIKALFFSLSFSFLLGGVGFLIRLFFLRRMIGFRHVVSFGLISVEKLFDFLLAFIVFFFLFTVPHQENAIVAWVNENKIIILIPLFLFMIWFYFHQRKVFKGILTLLVGIKKILPIPARYYYFWKRQIFYLYRSLDSIPPGRILFFIAQSLLVFTVESSFFYFSLMALGVEVDFSQSLLINSVIVLAFLIPVFPSGIGLFQAAVVFILGEAGNVFYASLILHFFLIITHLVIVSLGVYQFFNLLKIQRFRFDVDFLKLRK